MELRFKKLNRKLELLGKPAVGGLEVRTFPLTVWVEEFDDKNPVLLHTKAPPEILAALKKIATSAPVSTSTRASGILNTRAVYGVQPRIEIRANCRACRFAKGTFQDRKGFESLAAVNEWVSEQYRKVFPDHFAGAMKEVKKKVHEDWRWNQTPYLSMNCNFNQQIVCHSDSGNMPQALSTVLIASVGVTGGELDLPELGFSLKQEDGALTLFRGDKIIHGVRPFTRSGEKSFRASFVFYTLENMKVCKGFDEELERANFLECSKAGTRFTPEGKLQTLRKGKSFFSKDRFRTLEKKYERLATDVKKKR